MDAQVFAVYTAAKYKTLSHHRSRINSQNSGGYTALMLSVKRRNIEILQRLLAAGADPNITQTLDNNITALSLAIRSQLLGSVKELIRHGAHFSCTNGLEALEMAVHHRFIDEVIEGEKILFDKLSASKDFFFLSDNRKITKLETAIVVAYKNIRQDLMRKLIDWGLPLQRSLLLNFTQKNPELVSILIDGGADVNAVSSDQETALHLAVQANNIETIRVLIKAHVRTDVLDEKGETLLHKVTQDNQIEIAKLLHNAMADVNATNRDGETPLHQASLKGRSEMARLLIEANADINVANNDAETPLHSAVTANNFDMTKILIEAKANVDLMDKNGETPLHKAASLNFMYDSNLLKETEANVDLMKKTKQMPLYTYASRINMEILKLLIEARANINAVNKKEQTPLHKACLSRQSLEMIKFLLESEANVNCCDAEGKTPLLMSAESENSDIVECLLSNGADVNVEDKEGNTALSFAVINEDLRMARVLPFWDAKVNEISHTSQFEMQQSSAFTTTESPSNGIGSLQKDVDVIVPQRKNPSLLWKALGGYPQNIEMAKLLIKLIADVNIKNDEDITLLMFIVDRLDVELVEIITQAGADVNATDGTGHTALIRVLNEKNRIIHSFNFFHSDPFLFSISEENKKTKRILKILLKAGASVHGEGDKSPMVLAVKSNNKEFVKLIIDYGGDVNSLDNNLNTVLMLAINVDNFDIADMLLNAGCDVLNLQNDSGEIALHVAVKYNRSEILKIILKKTNEKQKHIKRIRKKKNKTPRKIISPLDAMDKDKQTPLHFAVSYYGEVILKLLIQSGACVNLKCRDGNTALMLALFDSSEQAANILLKAKTDVNIRNRKGETAILIAAKHCSSNLVVALKNAGADVHSVTNIGNSGLAYSTTAATADIFLAAGVNVNIRNVHGRTPLHCQVVASDLDVAALLISRGANVDEKDFSGDTPLILAYKKRNINFIQLLISAGAKVNMQNKKGKTALMYASSINKLSTYPGHVEALERLLRSGAAVNIRDNLGFTAAMHACKKKRKTDLNYAYKEKVRLIFLTVNTLLQHGADINAEDFRGRNILFHSIVSHGISDLTVKLLQQRMNEMPNEEYRHRLIDHNLSHISKSDDSGNEILRLFVCNGIFGRALFKIGLFSRKCQIVKSILDDEKVQQMKFIIANCFLTVDDFNFIRSIKPLTLFGDSPASMSPDENWTIEKSSLFGESSKKNQLVSLLHKAAREPWPLVKLAFITVSTMMGDSPRREARIRKSGLPPRLQELLMFQTPVARLPVSEWDNIPLCFDPDVYETLPRPRPLMTFWPFGKHLVV